MTDDEGGVAVVHCDCYVHKNTRFIGRIVERQAARRSSLCPLLGLTPLMAPPVRTTVATGEHKVQHRRIEDESVIEELYTFGEVLGKGSFGIVIEGRNVKTCQRWAIKKVNKEKAGSSAINLLEREVAILKRVKHEHIIFLEEIFETSKKMYLVMEICELGELRAILFDKGPFSEISARYIIRCLADAMMYLHKNGIVHRDLKLENILVAGCKDSNDADKTHPLYDIKLTDFGLSVVKGGVGSDSMLQSSCGTPVYMAPEVIQNHDYSQQCDNWSIGVILFALLSKEFPFATDKEERMYDMIKRGQIDFSNPVWTVTSDGAKHLIRKLLNINPAMRLTASEVTSHPWTLGSSSSSTPNPINVLDMMKDYAKEMANNPEEDELYENSQDDEVVDARGSNDESQEFPSIDMIASGKIANKSPEKVSDKSMLSAGKDDDDTNLRVSYSAHTSTEERRGSLPTSSKSSTKKFGSSSNKLQSKTGGRQTALGTGYMQATSSKEMRPSSNRLYAPGSDHTTYSHSSLPHSRIKLDTTSSGRLAPTLTRPASSGSDTGVRQRYLSSSNAENSPDTTAAAVQKSTFDKHNRSTNSTNKHKKKKPPATKQ